MKDYTIFGVPWFLLKPGYTETVVTLEKSEHTVLYHRWQGQDTTDVAFVDPDSSPHSKPRDSEADIQNGRRQQQGLAERASLTGWVLSGNTGTQITEISQSFYSQMEHIMFILILFTRFWPFLQEILASHEDSTASIRTLSVNNGHVK